VFLPRPKVRKYSGLEILKKIKIDDLTGFGDE